MKSFSGKVAAVTGAGSGIGRALALGLARRGCHLALSDIDEACERARDAELTTRLAVRAHADVVGSGRHTYGAFARRFEGVVAPLVPAAGPRGAQRSRRAVVVAAAGMGREQVAAEAARGLAPKEAHLSS